MTIEFCYLFFITADYYSINDFIVPKLLARKHYLLFVAAVVGIIAVSAGLRAYLALNIYRYYFGVTGEIDYGGLYLRSFINISLWVLAVAVGKMLVDRMQTQQQLEVLEKERVKSELDYLKAQINPHALFNSLNTIYGHIDKHNQVARNILLQFSELLRYQLYDCAAETVSLQNKICIEIHTNGTILYTSFLNTKELQPVDAGKAGGIGIANLRRRLELLYNKKFALTMNNDYDIYETNLTIDLS